MRLRLVRAILLTIVAVAPCAAQRYQLPGPVVDRTGPVTIWVLTPASRTDLDRIASKRLRAVQGGPILPKTVQESTAGDFGQVSSNYGQTSGSYGQTSGSYGTNASDHGQTAGSYGQSASDYGQNAGSFGKSASDHGQTAGSFGQSSSDFGFRLDGVPVTELSDADHRSKMTERMAARRRFERIAGDSYPATFVPVIAEELVEKLKAAEGTAEYPDVLLGVPLPNWWWGSGLGLTMLGAASPLNVASPEGLTLHGTIQMSILRNAPHPQSAMTFVMWMRGGFGSAFTCDKCPEMTDAQTQVGNIAIGAAETSWAGSRLGALADPEAAKFNAQLGRRLAFMGGTAGMQSGLEWRSWVASAFVGEQLAAVQVDGIGVSGEAFALMRAEVVLRRDVSRAWKVLHVTLNRPVLSDGTHAAPDMWDFFDRALGGAAPASVKNVGEAMPADGDVRPSRPDLWWDNPGDARLLVVEWQCEVDGEWSDPHLMLVPDVENRTRTRVTATFAYAAAKYRWRVWSVGAGGRTSIAAWRGLEIVQ